MATTSSNPFDGLDAIVQEHAPLAPLTWYRLGGPARYLVRPRTPAELAEVARRSAGAGLRVRVLGLGANLLVGDGGVDGVVVRLDAEHWRSVRIDGPTVEVGAGADLQKLIVRTVRAGLAGLEALAGIPGSLGGGVRMNAGGKFGDLGSAVASVSVMDGVGNAFAREKDDLLFGYRSTNISAPFILGATLRLEPVDDPDRLARRTKEIWMYKRNTQPLNTKSCGCVFKNPAGGGRTAGALIDAAGLKGRQVGGAQVSHVHANFIVAHPGARAADVLGLIGLIRQTVRDQTGVDLESEVRVWGAGEL